MGELLNLQQALLDGGIVSVNFFNGRLLTGKDLSREQQARRTADWRLGEAIGSGVAFGLDVDEEKNTAKNTDPGSAVLTVSDGLAVNRLGQVLRLTAPARVRLVRPALPGASGGKIFSACVPAGAGSYVAGAGLYLLTIAPAEASAGSAPTHGLDPLNVRCNTDATVEGVQFRLLPVKSSLIAGLGPGSQQFRNRLAHRCFGSDEYAAWLANPFGPSLDRYGLLDGMRDPCGLDDRDVPLALVHMVGAGVIAFIDRWSVRRRLHLERTAAPAHAMLSPRRLAEGEARFLQFQEQVTGLRTISGDLGAVTATTHFPHLPAMGVIPVNREVREGDAEAVKFFDGLTFRGPAFINSARLEVLLRHGANFPPIDVRSGEVVWLYRVRENAPASDPPASSGPRQYIVFASGHIPYLADARFDLAYWDNGNYALDR